MAWQNRIKGYRVVKAGELQANPHNWRVHPDNQKEAVQDVLGRVGWVSAVLYNVRTGRLIDGHLRHSLDPDAEIPVLDVDLSEEEEALVLSTFDPIAGMAATDEIKLKVLLKSLQEEDEALGKLVDEVASQFDVEMRDPLPVEDVELDDAQTATPTSKQETAIYPLAVVLTTMQNREWQDWKKAQGLKDDTTAFLRLMEIAKEND